MKRIVLPVLVTALLVSSCAKEERPVFPEDPVSEEGRPGGQQEEALAIPGTLIVLFDDDMTTTVEQSASEGLLVTRSMALNEWIDALGVVEMERLFPEAGEFEARTREAGLHRWYRIVFDPSRATVTKAGEALSLVPGVLVTESDRKIEPRSYPFNDPLFKYQWHFLNTGSFGLNYTPGVDVNCVPVWEKYTVGCSDVIVAVVDQGVDLTHEDLSGNTIAGGTEGSWNFAHGDAVITPGDHGTHVAGTIAAVNNNKTGVCGIAGGDAKENVGGVRILSCQIFTTDDSGSGSSANAIKWAADHGAVIVNNSWGYSYSSYKDESEKRAAAQHDHKFFLQPNAGAYTHSLKSAVDYVNKYAGMDASGDQVGPMAGGVCFFSAGNDAWEFGSPACYPEAVAVGAVGASGDRAYYSSYGDWVDLSAPGGDTKVDRKVQSTIVGGYDVKQGTSMACPHVSGVAALVVSYYGGAGFTREMLLTRLLEGANYSVIPTGDEIGGLVDALGAILYMDGEAPYPVTDYAASADNNTIFLSWAVTGSEQGLPAYRYRYYAARSEAALREMDPNHPGADIASGSVQVGEKEIGDAMEGRLTDLSFNTLYYVTICAFDSGGAASGLAPVQEVRTGVNHPPQISTDTVGPFRVRAHETLEIPYSITEPDGHSFTVSFTSGSGADSYVYTPTSSPNCVVRIAGPRGEAGTFTARLSATDAYGESASVDIPYTILENHAPENTATLPDLLLYGKDAPVSFDLQDYMADPDGEELQFDFSIADRKVLYLKRNKTVLTGNSLGFGLTDVAVSGTDAKGLAATQTFRVLVREEGVAFALYPNPVTDILHIATGAEKEPVSVRVTGATGALVYEGTQDASAFSPAEVDFSACASGKYNVRISFGGETFNRTVIKK